MNTAYTDGSGVEYNHPQEAIEAWSTGCDLRHDEDDEESDMCERGNLCEYCYGEVADAKKAQDKIDEHIADVWLDAQLVFVARAEAMGLDGDEVYELTSDNRMHGAYMQAHGACSETIMEYYDEDTKTLHMHDDEIGYLIDAMGGASERHENTGYDDMRACGISRDNAREYVALGV